MYSGGSTDFVPFLIVCIAALFLIGAGIGGFIIWLI